MNSIDSAMSKLFREILAQQKKKEKDYAQSWRLLGSKGTFAPLFFKANRLKALLWDNQTPNFESARDNLIDLITYGLYTLILLDEEWGQ